MGAREKLNGHHVLGALGVAAIIGGLAGSWGVFILVAVAMIGVSLCTGEIRRGKDGKW